MFENTSVVIMYAVSPCHAGSGSSVGVVDLPIQRERHTNYPVIQSSGVKGAFRANFDSYKANGLKEEQIKDFEKLTDSVFGSSDTKEAYSGSLAVGDARILAYPMRSNESPFVWITCPAVLKRFVRDLDIAGAGSVDLSQIIINENEAVSIGSKTVVSGKDILLEDMKVTVKDNSTVVQVVSSLKEYFKDAEKLLLVNDDVFDYGVSECTQIMAQIKIDSETGTTSKGSLRYQEELPADSIMYTVIHWGNTRSNAAHSLGSKVVRDYVKKVISNHIQIAGDETCGRGIFQLTWKDFEAK